MAGRLEGKVVIITGSGGSIGRACAVMAAREGAKVVGCDINAEWSAETVSIATREGGEMIAVHPCDLTRPDDVEKMVELALDTYGGVDGIFNNAGSAWFNWMDDITFDDWRKTMDIELDAIFHCCKAVWPRMKERGGGSIINMGSTSGKEALSFLPALAHMAAKGGVIAMTKQLAMEGAPHLIRANTISPGSILTNQSRPFHEQEEWRVKIEAKIMLDRVGMPEDIAPLIVYLLSDESTFVTGADLAIDGGTTAW